MSVSSFPTMPEKSRSLTPRQERAILALVAGKTLGQAAVAAHVDAKTLFRWRSETVFAKALRASRDAAFAATLDELRFAAGESVATARALLRPSQKAEVRLGAARVLLAIALKANDDINVEARLKALEDRIK